MPGRMQMSGLFERAALRRGGDILPASRLAGPMPWVVAIMVALTVLATGGALSLANFARDTRSGLESGVTIQVVEADAAKRQRAVQAIESTVRRIAGVQGVRPVPQDELERLVEPWLGDAAGSDAIAMPALVDVSLAAPADETMLRRLQGAVAQIAPEARVDAQADWLAPVFDAIRALRWLALMLIVLLTFASAAAVWLAARNALDGNRETIEIVHHLGAGDAQIARLFQRSVLIDSAFGGVIGLAIGGTALALLGARFSALQSGLVESGSLGPIDWLLVALVPAIMTGVAMVTARRTVLARLGRML